MSCNQTEATCISSDSSDEPGSVGLVFASLIPISQPALEAYKSAANVVMRQPKKFPQAPKSMLLPCRSQGPYSINVLNEDARSPAGPEKPIQGYSEGYVFKLDPSPNTAKHGWYLGSGGVKAAQIVNILLCDPEAKPNNTYSWPSRIANVHAVIKLQQDTCRLVLEARHRLYLHVGPKRILLHHTDGERKRVLLEGDILEIRGCTYRFSYARCVTDPFLQSDVEEQLSKFMTAGHGKAWNDTQLLPRLGLSPADTPNRSGSYSWSRSHFASGSFGHVYAGEANDGTAVVMKHIKEPKATEQEDLRKLMKHLGQHPNIIFLRDVLADWNALKPLVIEVYEPFAFGDLEQLGNKCDLLTINRGNIITDLLAGAAYLQKKGVMHRDIKPSNIGLYGAQPIRAMIMDMGTAIIEDESDDPDRGTVRYLAPEIMAIMAWESAGEDTEEGIEPPKYGPKIDVWALGITFFETFFPSPLLKLQADEPSMAVWEEIWQHLRQIVKECEDERRSRCAQATLDMLAHDVESRPFAADLLEKYGDLKREDGKEMENGSPGAKSKGKRPHKDIT